MTCVVTEDGEKEAHSFKIFSKTLKIMTFFLNRGPNFSHLCNNISMTSKISLNNFFLRLCFMLGDFVYFKIVCIVSILYRVHDFILLAIK